MHTKKIFLYIIILLLTIVPFFWLKSGEVNLGGDSSRIYLYQPLLTITNYVFYGINPWNIAMEMVGYFLIPFAAFLALILFIVKTPHNLINVFNSFTLVIAFIGTYASIYSVVLDADKSEKKNKGFARTAGIIGGLFYIFSPNMTNWDKALLTFNQIFLDPLMFFLLYKYVTSKKVIYAIEAILVTFIFAPNFSFIGAPSFFSFFPIVFLYLFVACIFIRKTAFNYKQLILLICLFLGIHAFQLLPQVILIANPTSIAAQRVFSQNTFNYADYFERIAAGVKVVNNLLGLPQSSLPFDILFFIFPFLIVFSLLQKIDNNYDKYFRKNYILAVLCFLILLFFVSAKITHIGFLFYANLFKIPGFGMFRNFQGQFVTSFFFFYALVIGFALYTLYQRIQKRLSIGITIIIVIILSIRGLPLLNGSMMYLPILQSKVASPFTMPVSFEKTLQYISEIKTDAKVLALPLTDFGYLMIGGEHGGLYIGSSLIGPVTLKYDFGNYDSMGPFGKIFIQAVKEKDTATLKNILAVLNIQDVFWEKDPYIYGSNFPNFPFGSTKNYIPTTVSAYQSFVDTLPTTKKVTFGKYFEVLNLDSSTVLPKIFSSSNVVFTNNTNDTPFLINHRSNNPSVILAMQEPSINLAQTSFQADIRDSELQLNDNLQFHIAKPEVSWKPGSIGYAFIIWKEKRSLTKLLGQDKMNTAYLYLAKRIEELNKWGNDIPIIGKTFVWHEPKIWEITKWNNYNSWEAIIEGYRMSADDLITNIDKYPMYEVSAQKFIAFEQFEQHRRRIQDIISNLDNSPDDKKYLSNLNKALFDELEAKINVNSINPDEKKYTIHLPENAEGDYNIVVSHMLKDITYSAINIQGKQYFPQKQQDVIYYGQVPLPTGKEIPVSLQATTSNLSSYTVWEGSGTVKNASNIDTLSIRNTNENIEAAMIKQIPLLVNSQQYVISFQYKTNNSPFVIKVFDKRSNNQGTTDTQEYSNRILLSNDWKLYQTVFTVDPQTKAAYIEILNNMLQGTQDIALKDVTITAVNSPILTFQKITKENISPPNITFQRVNPTKYKIFVTNANKPYILSFLEAYSKNWKLYYKPSFLNNTVPISKTYFGGLIKEGGHTNTFLDKNTFETWWLHSIANGTHVMGDGYANSWVINPKDTQGSNQYELILELKSQRYFYIGIVISLVSFIIMLAVLVMLLKKRIKK